MRASLAGCRLLRRRTRQPGAELAWLTAARPTRHAHHQVSAYAYALGLVTMLLALPHTAVLTGVWATTFQVGAFPCLRVPCSWPLGRRLLRVLLPSTWAGQPPACATSLLARAQRPCARPRSVVRVLPVPQPSPPCLAADARPHALQAGVLSLLGCMVFTLRGRISGRMSVLPGSAGGSAAALAGPKHH